MEEHSVVCYNLLTHEIITVVLLVWVGFSVRYLRFAHRRSPPPSLRVSGSARQCEIAWSTLTMLTTAMMLMMVVISISITMHVRIFGMPL